MNLRSIVPSVVLLAGLGCANAVGACGGAGTTAGGSDEQTPPPAPTGSASSPDGGADATPPAAPTAPSFCARAKNPLFCADFDGADATGGFTLDVSDPSKTPASTIAATDAMAMSPPRSLRAIVPASARQAMAYAVVKVGSAPRATVSFAVRPVVGKTFMTMARVRWTGYSPQVIELRHTADGYELNGVITNDGGGSVPLAVPLREAAWSTVRLELDLDEGRVRAFVDGAPATPELPALGRRDSYDSIQLDLGVSAIGDASVEAAFDDVLVTAP